MVKIRLTRRGRKKYPLYDVVIADARAPRDGRYIERIGRYNPNTVPASIDLDDDKALQWLLNGAQPTDTVRAMLSYRGVMLKKHLQIGVNKGAITQEEADKRFQEWKDTKDAKITARKSQLASDKDAASKAKLEAEAKVKEARAEALKKKAEEETKAQEAENQDAENQEAENQDIENTTEEKTEE